MGRSSPFTEQQKHWLIAKLPEFTAAQDKKTLHHFWRPFYVAWFKVHPFVDPDATVIAANDSDIEKARAEKLKAEKSVSSWSIQNLKPISPCVQKLYNWFFIWNRTQEDHRLEQQKEKETPTFPDLHPAVLREEMESHPALGVH